MSDAQAGKTSELHELAAADRAYRMAYRQMTGSGDPSRASFHALLTAIRRLENVVRRLEERESAPEYGGE